MALIVKSEEFFILSAHRSIFVYKPKDQTHSKVEVPQILRKKHENNGNADDKNGNEENEGNVDDESTADKDHLEFGDINRLAISPDNRLLAATTTGDKFLFFYQINNGALSLLQSHPLSRATSVLRFTPDSKHLLVADKTGDCYIHDCHYLSDQTNHQAKWILGHLSIVLDVLMTKNMKYIITSDRDEKVRVTNYPRCEEVESYCLGHLEFVSAIEELQTDVGENVLISISGDKTLRLWNYLNGKELFRLELPARGLRLSRNTQNEFAIVLFDEKVFKIGIFKLTVTDSRLEVHAVAEHTLGENVKFISSIIYESDNSIWFAGLDEKNEAILKRLDVQRSNNQTQILESNLDDLLNILKENLPSIKLQACEDITQLFKKAFDNLTDYQERKKRRIELKHTK